MPNRVWSALKIVVLLLLPVVAIHSGCGQNDERVLPIVYPVSVDSLLEVGRGVREEFEHSGWTTREFSAEGDAGRFAVAVESAFATGAPVVITVGTQITNTALGPKYDGTRPSLVAAAIFDPDEITIDKRGANNLAMVSDHPAGTEAVLAELIQALFPSASKVGIYANKGEANSVASAKTIVSAVERLGLKPEIAYIANPADLAPATRTLLARGVELIVIPHDKVAVAQAATVVQLALASERKVPVLSLDEGTVINHGVLACVSADYRAIGRHAGRIARDAINGRAKGGVIYPDELVVAVNRSTAAALDLTIPEDLPVPVRYVGGSK